MQNETKLFEIRLIVSVFCRLPLSFWRYSHIKTVRGVDEVINHGRLLLVELLHGSAAAVVLDPLQNQAHDVNAEPRAGAQSAGWQCQQGGKQTSGLICTCNTAACCRGSPSQPAPCSPGRWDTPSGRGLTSPPAR